MLKKFQLILLILGGYFSEVVNSFGAEFLCNQIPGLTPKQRLICESSPDAIAVIGEGTKLGISECQHQFRFSRWNCTPIGTEQSYGHVVVVGSREAAFLYAITSSGVTYSVTQACARGNISSCGCAPPTTISTSGLVGGTPPGKNEWGTASTTWRWGGCSADVDYAVKLARKFMDSRELEGDARSLMNLHNNKAGRKTVQSTLETECKCHGVSGSCTLKTCWLKLPSFREIGDRLLEKYQKARPVVAVQGTKKGPRSRRSLMLLVRPKPHFRRHNRPHQSTLSSTQYTHLPMKLRDGKRSLKDSNHLDKRNPKPKRNELVYLEQSPNYCEQDSTVGSLGTSGRRCIKENSQNGGLRNSFSDSTSNDTGSANNEHSCDILCCGRGYNTHQMYRSWKCGCKFRWCCEVHCQNCQDRVEIYTCN